MSGTKGKPGRGRKPIPITQRDKRQIEALASMGVPLDNIAKILNISPRTLDKWLKLPDIAALYKKGRIQAEITVAKALFDKALSGCLPAIVWYERTRCDRSERNEVQHTGSVIIFKTGIVEH